MQTKIESMTMAYNAQILRCPDCISLSEIGTCRRLNVLNCQGDKCSFRRTPKEEYETKHNWARRLLSLDDSEQLRIARKYYGGSMPWK